jgi:hypothetical protein
MEGVWYKREQVNKSLSQLGVDAAALSVLFPLAKNVKCS